VHLGKCAQNRIRDQKELPKNKRTPPPSPPEVSVPDPDASTEVIDAYNAAVLNSYNATLPVCEVCGRKFADVTRLAKHAKGCKSGHYKGPKGKAPAPAKWAL